VTDLEVSFDVTSGFDALEAPDKLPTIFNGDKTVIYGIFRSKAASDQPLEAGVSGTATLKGKILGASFEHAIPFEIPAPSGSPDLDSFQMPIVHQLAAKSLIRDWEHKEGWASISPESERKKEIIRVSIESSVVSAHTAYIAVDEDQDKPIEGAIQTWDLSATTGAGVGGFGFGGGSNMHGRGGMLFGGPPPPQAYACAAAAPASGLMLGGPPQMQQQSFFAPYAMGGGGGGHGGIFGAPAAAFSGALGGPPPPPPARSMMMAAGPPPPPTGGVWPPLARNSAPGAPPPPAFAAGPPPPPIDDLFSFNSAQQFHQAAVPKKSRSINAQQQFLQPAKSLSAGVGASSFQSPSNELTQLISLQQAEGFWNLDKVSSFMKKTISSPIPGVDPIIWATVVALVLLESRFSQQQDEWELVAMKAETWLSMQSLPAGFDIQKLKEEAKKLV
jgi:hypothetical protein